MMRDQSCSNYRQDDIFSKNMKVEVVNQVLRLLVHERYFEKLVRLNEISIRMCCQYFSGLLEIDD